MAWQRRNVMKKFFVSLVMLLSTSAVGLFAQSSLIATLSHEGEITAFYGADALKEAHEAAVHGDAITLSSGTFNATSIAKAITLRGAGMQVDTINNILPTIIYGDFTIHLSDTLTTRITIEGIYNSNMITLGGTLKNARFIKCRFGEFRCQSATNGYMVDCSFIHCKVGSKIRFTDNGTSCSFINCYLNQPQYLSSISGGNIHFQNCIVRSGSGGYYDGGYAFFYSYGGMAFYNCVLEGSNYNVSNDVLSSSSVAYNCVVVGGSASADVFKNISNTTNSRSSHAEVFKDYTGTYNDDITFELTDEAKAMFLGTDDTQVGIYGGNFPYDPTTTNPHITKCNVAAKSTADGKLSVDIEVAGVE